MAHYTPDRCPRCGGESLDEFEASRPSGPGAETVVVVALVVVPTLSVLAGALMLGVDGEPGEVRFLGLMPGIALASLCVGMAARFMRRPAP